jgi:general secretion pathway protein D
VLLPALILSGCQSMDNQTERAPAPDQWNAPPRARLDNSGSYGSRPSGIALFGDKSVAEPTIMDGTGRFLGSRRTVQTELDGTDAGVTLNLVNVPISQAAKTVLGDLLAVKYTLDPSLEGKVTLQTPGPVSKSAAVDLFQSALRSSNAALVFAGGNYKIVPIDQANAGAGLRVEGDADTSEKIGSSLRVIQLKYVNAAEIRRILDPISPRGTIVRTDDVRNTITLSGNEQDINGLLDAISVFDVDVMRGMSFAIVPVRISQPGTIADEVKTIFASQREGPMAGMVQFLPNRRLGAILVITPQKSYLARAITWIHRLDTQAQGSEKQFYTYAVQNRSAEELVGVLQSMFSSGKDGGSSRTRNIAPQYQETSAQSSGLQPSSLQQTQSQTGVGLGGATSPSVPMPSQSRQQPTGPSSDITSTVQLGPDDSGEARIKVVADDNKNAILIEATPADYRRVMRMIEALDVLPNQVLIEATIAEIRLNDELKFGLRWFLQQNASNYTFTDSITGSVGQVFPGFSYALTAANVAATLTALSQITDINIISSPSLTVADNKTATLQVGDQVPITTQTAVSVLTPGAPVVNSVTYKDTGVILSITPRINESGRVMLDIEQEVSSVAQTTSSAINSPTITRRRVKTSVIVNNGEAFALGGMIQDSKTVTRTQVPLLGDIPVIGDALKMKDNLVGKTELIVLIAPRVIRTLSEARAVTDEFRRELAVNIPDTRRQPRTPGQTLRRMFE